MNIYKQHVLLQFKENAQMILKRFSVFLPQGSKHDLFQMDLQDGT